MLGFLLLVAKIFNNRAPDPEQPINRLGRDLFCGQVPPERLPSQKYELRNTERMRKCTIGPKTEKNIGNCRPNRNELS